MAVSIIILTLNEQVNLAGCLECVKWSDDIVVFDSFSADITVEIAKSAGARLVQREFDDYASHRNAALSEVEDEYPWVLMLDADERVTPQLAEEIEATLSQATADITLYRVRRKDMFLGKWLRRSSGAVNALR